MSAPGPLLGFVAWSGTGKTTLLERLIPLLAREALMYDCGNYYTEEACNVSTRRHYSY